MWGLLIDSMFFCPELRLGQYLTCLVERVKNDGRVVSLSVNPAAVAQACAEPRQGWSLSNLLPGLLVKSTVKKVKPFGPECSLTSEDSS